VTQLAASATAGVAEEDEEEIVFFNPSRGVAVGGETEALQTIDLGSFAAGGGGGGMRIDTSLSPEMQAQVQARTPLD